MSRCSAELRQSLGLRVNINKKSILFEKKKNKGFNPRIMDSTNMHFVRKISHKQISKMLIENDR